MSNKQKLELTWIGKDEELNLEPRILIEDPTKSYGDPKLENMLIHGDNLLALRALEQDFAGKIKCIYIDPPYNTGSAFDHYDDNLEHSTWLSLMKPRLEILKELLHPSDGSIWISIDDDECHYLKVLCDEVFGRNNFVANIIWHKRFSPNSTAVHLSDSHDHILCYAKNKQKFRINLLPRNEKSDSTYKNPDNDHRGVWTSSDLSARNHYSLGTYPVVSPSGREISGPPPGRYWTISKEKFIQFENEGRIWWGVNGNNQPRFKRFLTDVREGVVPQTIWSYEDVGHTQEAKKEMNVLFPDNVFDTPKPERLIRQILEIGSNTDDWVLDSFLGSGTTSAVAHKMGRKYIGIEFGSHADTHCLPRLKKVVDGKDGLALSEVLDWKGGGGFKFYNLAPSLLKKDRYDRWIIDEQYNANMLAAAMCKHEGFGFSPNEEVYWKHGGSTETDFIFVTTAFMTVEQMNKIHSEMLDGESLLICAKSFAPECEKKYTNITLKKIPQMILGRCEFGKENYDLNIIKTTEEIAEDQDIAEE